MDKQEFKEAANKEQSLRGIGVTSRTSRIHKGKIAHAGNMWLEVDCKDGVRKRTAAMQVPSNLTPDQVQVLVKSFVKKLNDGTTKID